MPSDNFRMIYKDAEGGVIQDQSDLKADELTDRLQDIIEEDFDEGETVEIRAFASE